MVAFAMDYAPLERDHSNGFFMGLEKVDGEEYESFFSPKAFPSPKGITKVNLVRPRDNHPLPLQEGSVCKRHRIEKR